MKSKLITGTLILTIAGFLTRILGFFYRLLLSNILGTELLGIYQLIFPIYGLCFTLYASGIQTAISKMVAENTKGKEALSKKILFIGIGLSLSIAICCSLFLYISADFIASDIIKEPRCSQSLKLLCGVFPACSMSACINGFYYGKKQTMHPAIAQLIEQISRIAFSVLYIVCYAPKTSLFSCETAVIAIFVGELTAAIYNLCVLQYSSKKITAKSNVPTHKLFKQLCVFSIPLTTTHLIISLLHSIEAILIPNLLQKSGMTLSESLSIYGILTGMTMSLLMFPSTITNSLCVLLLPSISEAAAEQNRAYINKAIRYSFTYSLAIGGFIGLCFLVTGPQLGLLLFHNRLSGVFLQNLSWLCPMLYLSSTLSSILNGLGKMKLTFRNTSIGLFLRILLLLILIPYYGISGYFYSLLISQFISSSMDVWIIRKSKYS